MRLNDEQRMLRHLTRIWLAYLAVLVWLVPVILLPALSATAQNSGKIPRIGYIWFGAEDSDRATRPGLQQGLRELGYQGDHNIIIDYRYAGGSIERLRELVADTIASRVDVIVVPGVIVADAVKHASATVPVVALAGDAVASGLATSLARPGGNITGFSSMEPD